jgi:hypothetical protein
MFEFRVAQIHCLPRRLFVTTLGRRFLCFTPVTQPYIHQSVLGPAIEGKNDITFQAGYQTRRTTRGSVHHSPSRFCYIGADLA